jgi:hypothetical protein
MFAPLEGWRHVKVTDRRTAVDYAHVRKDLAGIHFLKAKILKAKKIVLVQDNSPIETRQLERVAAACNCVIEKEMLNFNELTHSSL